jgi:hypothetical protein
MCIDRAPQSSLIETPIIYIQVGIRWRQQICTMQFTIAAICFAAQ